MADPLKRAAAGPLTRPDLERLIAGLIRDYAQSEGPVVIAGSRELAATIQVPVAAATGVAGDRVITVLQGAVSSAIAAHGPIRDAAGAASAAKRAVVQFRADGLWRAAPLGDASRDASPSSGA